jgi:hypothetical protein
VLSCKCKGCAENAFHKGPSIGRSTVKRPKKRPRGVIPDVRTIKEQVLWARTFATVEELAGALREFKRTYNERWLIGRHGHRTPARVRRGLAGSKAAAA